MVFTAENPLLAPELAFRTRALNWVWPVAVGVKFMFSVVTPVCQGRNEPPGSFFWTSNTSPAGGAADAHVILKVVPSVPVVGTALMGTFTVPIMIVGWMAQW